MALTLEANLHRDPNSNVPSRQVDVVNHVPEQAPLREKRERQCQVRELRLMHTAIAAEWAHALRVAASARIVPNLS